MELKWKKEEEYDHGKKKRNRSRRRGGCRREDAIDENAVVERPCAQVLRGSDRT